MACTPCADDDEQHHDKKGANDESEEDNVGDEPSGSPGAISGVPIPEDQSDSQTNDKPGSNDEADGMRDPRGGAALDPLRARSGRRTALCG